MKAVTYSAKESAPFRPQNGLKGITLTMANSFSIKVTDRKGMGLPDVKLTDGALTYFTDINGNASTDFASGVTVSISKNKHTSSFLTQAGGQMTVVFEPPPIL